MRLVEMNWEPTPRQLRQFGAAGVFALPALAWFWSGGNSTAVMVCAAAGAVLAGAGMIRPGVLKPVFVGLSLVTLPIGLVMSELALCALFFGMFVPLGLAFRCIGRNELQLAFEKQQESYWQPKRQPPGPASYYRLW